MITLKLASYSKKEVDKLASILESIQPELHKECLPNRECKDCPIRHLCMDIAQATMYAEEYEPSHRVD